MAEVGITLLAVVMGVAMICGVEFVCYWVWLYRFNREWRIKRVKWYWEHKDCCDLDQSYLNG